MTVCSECGGPLDPDVTHVQHVDGCPNAYTFTFSGPDLGERVRAWLQAQDDDTCDCPEVCANHCTDPGCVLRPDQETPMTDSSPAPLEPGEVAVIKACIGKYTPSHIARLVATVEQVRRERDAAYAVIRRMDGDWRPLLAEGPPTWRQFFYASTSPTLRGDHRDEPMSSAEVDAIRRAQAVSPDTPTPTGPGEVSHE